MRLRGSELRSKDKFGVSWFCETALLFRFFSKEKRKRRAVLRNIVTHNSSLLREAEVIIQKEGDSCLIFEKNFSRR